MFNSLSKILLKNSNKIIILIFLITGCFFWIAFVSSYQLKVDFSLEQMFPENDPEKDIYDSFIAEFNREDDKVLLVYSCENPLSRDNIVKVSKITEMLELDAIGVESVISLSNINDGNYFSDALSDSKWSLNVERVLAHPIYPNLIISKDGKTGAILIDLEDDIIGQYAREKVLDSIDDILKTSDWQWYEAGIPVLRTRYIQFMNYERSIFIPISFLVAAVILFFIFRQPKIIIISLVSILTTLIWIAGIMALFQISINVVSYLTFNLLMIIGASNSIHLLIKYHEGLGMGLGKKESLDRVVARIGPALFLTSFTTAVGFSSLAFTNIRITQQFGLIVGFGVLLMFILIIILMPILLNIISKPKDHHIYRLSKSEHFKSAYHLCVFNSKFPISILCVSGLVFIISFFGLSLMDYNASVLEDLRPGNSLYDNLNYVDEKLGGSLSLEVIIEKKDDLSCLNPDFIKKMQNLKETILNVDEISFAITPGDYIMLINEEFGSGFREVPENVDEVLSLVIDYDPVQNLYNSNYSKARISCRISDIPYERGMEIRDNILTDGYKIFGDNVDLSVTGSTLLALSTSRHLVKNLTTSFIIAFIIIFISIVILFKSFRLSMISILPNIIPLMIAGGLMGYLGIKLRPSTAMTFSIALGIAVDNTIHFLARFREEFHKSGDYNKSVTVTILTTGKAIISTGIILSLGFFVLYFSEFVPNHEFGLLATIIIVTAVGGSLILLPVLIVKIKPRIRFASNDNN